jgi:hypothetical protein
MYKAFFESKTLDLEANSSYDAWLLAVKEFKASVSKRHQVVVVLLDIELSTSSVGGWL